MLAIMLFFVVLVLCAVASVQASQIARLQRRQESTMRSASVLANIVNSNDIALGHAEARIDMLEQARAAELARPNHRASGVELARAVVRQMESDAKTLTVVK